MSLKEYKAKRHFKKTPEPAGRITAAGGFAYVIQKHDASHLHYDFRLELDGVLKSWAVPKGPCLDPAVKRLAVHVEDHPVDYGSFEGTIPQGQYGGGTVMLWDRGIWEPLGDPDKDYQAGRLKFVLHGEKLHGRWMLVRTGSRSGRDPRQWLLFKERDESAVSLSQSDILEAMPESVTTGRDLEEIAAGAPAKKSVPAKRTRHSAPRKRSRAKTKRTPAKIEVQLATLAREAPDGDEWLHEIKYDGYRMIARIDSGEVRLLTRNQNDWTNRLPSLTRDLEKLPVQQAILDGEIVALRDDGVSDFQTLQNAFRTGKRDSLMYFIFDLLYLDGVDATRWPLSERKTQLSKILSGKGLPKSLRYSEHIDGNGRAVFRQAAKSGVEGIISKRRDQPYKAGRGLDWLKIKCIQNGEFIIGGFTEPSGSRSGFGALLVGERNRRGHLIYTGKVGTGFDDDLLRSLHRQLQSVEQKQSPFQDFKKGGRGTHWVQPVLVGQIAFGTRTHDGILRHAVFQGLREDKRAADVHEEQAVSLAVVKDQSSKMKRRTKTASSKDHYDSQRQLFAGVRLTSPEKVLYPQTDITKLDLAAYYRSIADWILPEIQDRPIVLVRCPEGESGECFFQKHPAMGTPDNLRRIPVKEKSKTGEYVVVDDVEGLISLAQISAMEIHVWGSRADRLDFPDRLVFDLDPAPDVPWSRVVDSAKQVREFLQDLGLESFVRTTGGKGVHLVVPIERRHEWKVVKQFCHDVANLIVAADSRNYVAVMAKAARRGKIFVDYLRNDRGATAVVSYSPRNRPGAPVATPLSWREFKSALDPAQFTISTLANRLARLKNDPWEKMKSMRQSLTKPLKTLQSFGSVRK